LEIDQRGTLKKLH